MSPLALGFNTPKNLIELMILLNCKNNTITQAVLEVWLLQIGTGLGYMKKSRKEAVVVPDFKKIIFDGISKTVYDGRICSCKPDQEHQFPRLCKKYPVSVFKLWDSYFAKVQFYFDTDKITAIFKVILPNFIEEIYCSAGNFSITNFWTSTLQ